MSTFAISSINTRNHLTFEKKKYNIQTMVPLSFVYAVRTSLLVENCRNES